MSRIRANQITNQSADGAPTVQNGLVISGVTTSTTLSISDTLSHSGDNDTKIRFPSADTVSIETGGNEQIRINHSSYIQLYNHIVPNNDSTKDIGLTGTRFRAAYVDTYYGDGSNLTGITGTTINNNANNRIITGSGTANTLEGESTFTYGSSLLTTEKRMVIGNGSEFQIPSRSNTSSYTPQFQVTGAWNNPTHGGTMALNGRTDYPLLWLNSGASFQDNSGCGVITWSIKDGAGNYCNTAEIRSHVDGTPGNNNSPGDLSFRTTPAGTCQPTEALRIDSSNRVLIGSTAKAGDSILQVYTSDRLHPAIRVHSGNANGFTLLADAYTATESNINFGISYSSASLVISQGCKVNTSSDNAYISSQGQYSTRPNVIRLGTDSSFSFLNTASASTTPTDNAVSLTERLRIDSNGQVTKPSQASFAAMKSGNAYSLNGQVFPFDTTTHNVGSHFNTSNYRFTAPVAGRYLFTFYSILNSSGQGRYEILINGSADQNGTRVHMTPNTSNWDHVSTSWILNLAANDYIQMYSQTNTGWHGGHWQRFCGELLS